MKIVSVGTVAFDAIETPFGKTDKIVGGACTYISLSAAYFNNSPHLISVVGEDFPNETIALFKERGINTEGLQIKNKRYCINSNFDVILQTKFASLAQLVRASDC